MNIKWCVVLASVVMTSVTLPSTAEADTPLWQTHTYEASLHCSPQTTLQPSQFLLPGWTIWSADGRYKMTLQYDGNLVLYRAGRGGVALWSSMTNGLPIEIAIMQSDGNLVLYDYSKTPRWASWTNGNPGAYLALQCDGNVVIYGRD